jgi:hypothetical protein
MNPSRFDWLIQTLGATTGRRTLLHGAAALGAAALAGGAHPDAAAAKILCRKNGSKCRKKSKKCQAKFCLKAPFTIEARWSNANSDHDTILFVPKKEGSNPPSPYIWSGCTPAVTDCENEVYPFACVSKDALGPGDEITTVRRLLAGRYEYWIELWPEALRGELEVILRNGNGRTIRSWSSPENPDNQKQLGWHVFDIDGASRSITSVDTFVSAEFPWNHDPSSGVCPGVP